MSLLRALEDLMQALPGPAAAEPADQARWALSLLRMAESESTALPVAPTQCPNCGSPAASTKSPYCGPDCREEASFVRQFRAGLSAGWISDPEKQLALGQNLWRLLGGGWPYRQTLILERSKAKALSRTGGLCQTCGAPATSFDHINTACNRDINLRPVCAQCTQTRPFHDAAFASAVAPRLAALAARIVSEVPLRASDDAEAWDWRAFLRIRPGPGQV